LRVQATFQSPVHHEKNGAGKSRECRHGGTGKPAPHNKRKRSRDDENEPENIPLRCSMFDVRCSMFDVRCSPFPRKNEKSPPDLSVKQGQIGGWEFAMLSFPRWLFGARLF